MNPKNPVFRNSEALQRGGYATFNAAPPSDADLRGMYDAPSATTLQTGRMTLDDVVMKTAAMFAVLLAAAGVAWYLTPSMWYLPWVGMLGGLVLGLVITFKQSTNPALHLTYAVLEGLFVGGISLALQSYVNAYGDGTNIIAQAIIGTVAAFTAVLVLNRMGVLKATPRFTKMLFVAMGAYFLVALASFVFALFFDTNGFGFYNAGGLGLLLCVAGVALASFSLVIDFDFIEQSVRAGVPQRYSWLAAFGLVVTLVWLYYEILRLLAILKGND